jgi:hypothetical protein
LVGPSRSTRPCHSAANDAAGARQDLAVTSDAERTLIAAKCMLSALQPQRGDRSDEARLRYHQAVGGAILTLRPAPLGRVACSGDCRSVGGAGYRMAARISVRWSGQHLPVAAITVRRGHGWCARGLCSPWRVGATQPRAMCATWPGLVPVVHR